MELGGDPVIRLLTRLKRKPEPRLLSDAEMAELYEEIFDEPVSFEALSAKFSAVRADRRHACEWVMDQRTWDRIRRAHLPISGASLNFRNYESLRAMIPEDRLFGLPVVIEPGAKLSLRERAS